MALVAAVGMGTVFVPCNATVLLGFVQRAGPGHRRGFHGRQRRCRGAAPAGPGSGGRAGLARRLRDLRRRASSSILRRGALHAARPREPRAPPRRWQAASPTGARPPDAAQRSARADAAPSGSCPRRSRHVASRLHPSGPPRAVRPRSRASPPCRRLPSQRPRPGRRVGRLVWAPFRIASAADPPSRSAWRLQSAAFAGLPTRRAGCALRDGPRVRLLLRDHFDAVPGNRQRLLRPRPHGHAGRRAVRRGRLYGGWGPWSPERSTMPPAATPGRSCWRRGSTCWPSLCCGSAGRPAWRTRRSPLPAKVLLSAPGEVRSLDSPAPPP